MNIESLATQIVDSIYKVQSALGPGLLESAYQTCLAYELKSRGIKVETELLQPIQYREISVDSGYRIDMLIEDTIIIENKTVDLLLPVHKAQLITYLKMRNAPLGFLINWKEKYIKNGIQRFANNYKEDPYHKWNDPPLLASRRFFRGEQVGGIQNPELPPTIPL